MTFNTFLAGLLFHSLKLNHSFKQLDTHCREHKEGSSIMHAGRVEQRGSGSLLLDPLRTSFNHSLKSFVSSSALEDKHIKVLLLLH